MSEANSLWIHYFFREFAINFVSITRIYYGFILLLENWLWIHYLWCKYTMDSLPFSWIDYEFTTVTQIHNESIIFPRIYSESTIFLRIHYELTISIALSRIRYSFLGFTMNSLSFSRFQYKFIISFSQLQYEHNFRHENSPWINFLFRKSTMNSLPLMRIH